MHEVAPASDPASRLCRQPGHRPGFATVLVLLMVLLMMMLAIFYLRTMRAYTLGHLELLPNAGIVCDRIENDLAVMIGQDGQIGGATPAEPHDYPWTCTRMNARCQLVYPELTASDQALGDPKVDDAWLAPTEPILPGGGEGWTQVSNLYNSFLAYDDANLSGIPAHPSTGLFVPQDVPAGVTVQGLVGAPTSGAGPSMPASNSLCAKFQNLPLTDPRLVDTDGDGIPDSLWFYPPNSLQGNIRYVAAVRVVDLSSMLNLNTALGESQFVLAPDTLPDGSGRFPRKGEGPYEVDASSLVGTMPGAALSFRQTPAAVAPLSGWNLWLKGAACTDKRGEPYGDAPTKSGSPVNTNSPSRLGLRYDLNDEIQLRDLSNRLSTGANTPVPAPILGNHYPALNLSQTNPARPALTSFAALAADLKARGRVSTLGGARDVVAAVPVKGAVPAVLGGAAAQAPLDLNDAQGSEGRPTVASLSNYSNKTLIELLKGVNPYNAADAASQDPLIAYPYPAALKAMVASGDPAVTPNRAVEYGHQMAGALADALDNDSLASGWWNWLGNDPAPVLTEVYMQMPYWVTAAPTNNGNGTFTVTYGNNWVSRVANARIGSYAFELANPYPVPVRLENLRFRMMTFNGTLGGTYPYGFYSAALDTYITAAANFDKDAAGKWVLKPGQRAVFYRNGVDAAGTYAFSGSAKADLAVAGILPAASADVKLVNLGTANGPGTPLDLNGAATSWRAWNFQIEIASQYNNDQTVRAWQPTARVILPMLSGRGGTTADHSWSVANVPSGREAALSNVVYAQASARTFGPLNADGTPNRNLLQVRPPVHNSTTAGELLNDLGDFEVRVNFLPTSGSLNYWPYPATYTYTGTHLNYETANVSSLGQATKVAFPGPRPTPTAPATRQDLNAASFPWYANHTGIPGDATWKGTFPELNVVSSALTQRNNPHFTRPQRASGTPRLLDLLNVPLLGPIYPANTACRGSDTLIANKDWRNTLGDAWNYYLSKDSDAAQAAGTPPTGLRGLCLRRDVKFFDAARHTDLPFDAAKTYAIGDEALLNNEIYQAQAAGTLPAPDPTTGSGNVGPGLPWKLSNGPYARALQFWRISWAEAIISRFGLDGPATKGKALKNDPGFKPGTINLNTASKEVLKCLSLPAGADADKVADQIIAARSAPTAGTDALGTGGDRLGLAFASEAFGPLDAAATAAGAPDNTDLWSGTPPAGKTNFDILSWLPQQASCRSDVFCATIVVQGYEADDFNKGPVDVRRKVVIYSRDPATGTATILASKQVAGK